MFINSVRNHFNNLCGIAAMFVVEFLKTSEMKSNSCSYGPSLATHLKSSANLDSNSAGSAQFRDRLQISLLILSESINF